MWFRPTLRIRAVPMGNSRFTQSPTFSRSAQQRTSGRENTGGLPAKRGSLFIKNGKKSEKLGWSDTGVNGIWKSIKKHLLLRCKRRESATPALSPLLSLPPSPHILLLSYPTTLCPLPLLPSLPLNKSYRSHGPFIPLTPIQLLQDTYPYHSLSPFLVLPFPEGERCSVISN